MCVVCGSVVCASVCEMKMVSVAEGLTGRWYRGVSSLAKYILMIMMNKKK